MAAQNLKYDGIGYTPHHCDDEECRICKERARIVAKAKLKVHHG